MFDEDDLVPLSALQHLLFCERQCALIHLEGLWADNRLTAQGERLHERAHRSGESESRGSVRLARGVRLRSLRLGLAGQADVVEFHRVEPPGADASGAGRGALGGEVARGIPLPGAARCGAAPATGLWLPFPVEYKRGRPKRNRCDEVQLCAQAMCLEEMLGVEVPAGALFYGTTRRRFDVALDDALRAETEAAAARLHRLIASGSTPRACREPKCDHCSMLDLCLPQAADPGRSAVAYVSKTLAQLTAGASP